MIKDSRGMKSASIREFTDLKAWQEAHKLIILIYLTTKGFPKEEMYSLTDQLKRSAVSITANIAEGFGRQGYKEKVQFYYIAHGSLTELKNHLMVARDVGYLSQMKSDELFNQLAITHQLLQGLIRKSKTFMNPAS